MMHKLGNLHQKSLFNFVVKNNVPINVFENLFPVRNIVNPNHMNTTIQCGTGSAIVTSSFKLSKIKSTLGESVGELSEDYDDEVCPVECVREFTADEEFLGILEKAKETNALVIVDFYRTSCGSCRYIEQGFVKLCKGSGNKDAPVIFLKHNVIDEYDEQSEVADRLRIKTVPLFHFYKNGVLLEAFPTRDKERILEAILKYTAPASQEVESVS
ncbi:hypothetical protein CASFOL_000944 [Castilleja foliolosa]|uniref:Thioredoxin domain-containing protein n=1 Tax=Castilleja foliolosa TaxID=1961234 RepID=A0ABD3ELE9_9LAMI